VRVLYRAFLARFFENEVTSGTHDLRASFIWLIAFLSAPGFVLPALLAWFDWGRISFDYGAEVLRQVTAVDRFTYVTCGMVASGAIGVLVWHSVLVDRRDALILGALPVRGSTVVTAKLLGLVTYVGVIAGAMHLLASLTFGTLLADDSFARLGRGVLAHLAVSFSASVSVLLGIAATQALMLALVGPGRFRRLTSWLQVGLVFAVLVTLLSIPTMASETQAGLHGARAYYQGRQLTVALPASGGQTSLPAWLEATPPAWYFAAYEVALGTDDPVLHRLAGRALVATTTAVIVTLVVYPLAYRRLMVAAVLEPEVAGRPARMGRGLAAAAERVGGRDPTARAAAQFLVATVGRVDRHRVVAAAAIGAALAWAIPGLLLWLEAARTQRLEPQVAVLGVPFWTMLWLTVGVRVAIALPSDLKAGWLFTLNDLPHRRAWTALRRLLIGLVVAPIAVVSLAGVGLIWGPRLAITTALLIASVGILFVEILLWRGEGMPCSRAWAPQRANMRLWWPMYLAGAIWVSALPYLAVLLSGYPVATAVVLAGIVGFTVLVRLAARSPLTLGASSESEHDAAFQTLGLQ